MQLLRELFLCAAQFNFIVTSKHVPGKNMGVTDALSRFHMQVFFDLVPQAHPQPVLVPPTLLMRLSSMI